jgi:hypothetical protein
MPVFKLGCLSAMDDLSHPSSASISDSCSSVLVLNGTLRDWSISTKTPPCVLSAPDFLFVLYVLKSVVDFLLIQMVVRSPWLVLRLHVAGHPVVEVELALEACKGVFMVRMTFLVFHALVFFEVFVIADLNLLWLLVCSLEPSPSISESCSSSSTQLSGASNKLLV